MKVVIVGCGVVGAAIAYELSEVSGLKVTVIDRLSPAQGATKAALGVLMGVISHKVKGNAWKMRQASIQRYESLIPELERLTNSQILFNRQGILKLCFAGEDLTRWENLAQIRHNQGFGLEVWKAEAVASRCPHLNLQNVTAAIYSPQDRQVDPSRLTLALVEAARRKGVDFQFGVSVLAGLDVDSNTCRKIQTSAGVLDCDWLVISAGLGSTVLTASLNQEVKISPVLGQALHLKLEDLIGNADFQPVITADDVHIVPLGNGEYWVGATVEFPADAGEVVAAAEKLETVKQAAIAFCPALAEAKVLRSWSGLRPRPENRPAPVIGYLPGYTNVLLATGHYRNGVLLAPATATAIRETILEGMSQNRKNLTLL